MKPRHRITPTLILLAALIALIAAWWLPTSLAQAPVQVSAADPAATEQGTINLNVRVTGKGFKNGAKAKWFVTGTTDTGGVTVNSTTFVSSTELSANITVSDTAVIGNFDIQVLNSDGRGGKGTELFAVTAKGQAQCPATQPAPSSDTRCYDAGPGCWDSTFGGSGFVYTKLTTFKSAAAMALQTDGKIVVIAQVQSSSSGMDFGVLRYNNDGSLDTSFGDPDPLNPLLRLGYTTTAVTTNNDQPAAILVQLDGKIVVSGSADVTEMAAVRYNIDGTLDASFGTGGIVRIYFGTTKFIALARNLAQQSDGKIVLAGTGSGQFAIARLLPNGSLDAGFGSNGKLSVNASGARNGNSSGLGVALQRVPAVTGEERILVSGSSKGSSNANSDWTLMRFRSDGSTDTSFGTGGTVKTTFSGLGDTASRVRVDSSNRILASGNINMSSSCGLYAGNAALVRYTQDGGLDGTFNGGKQIVDVYGGLDNFGGTAFQPDGKIVFFGSSESSDGTVRHLVLLRYNVDGTHDTSFGLLGNGMATMDVSAFGGSGGPVLVQPGDGKIVVLGNVSLDSNGSSIALGRYWP